MVLYQARSSGAVHGDDHAWVRSRPPHLVRPRGGAGAHQHVPARRLGAPAGKHALPLDLRRQRRGQARHFKYRPSTCSAADASYAHIWSQPVSGIPSIVASGHRACSAPTSRSTRGPRVVALVPLGIVAPLCSSRRRSSWALVRATVSCWRVRPRARRGRWRRHRGWLTSAASRPFRLRLGVPQPRRRAPPRDTWWSRCLAVAAVAGGDVARADV